MVAGVAGTAALAVGIQGSVHQPATAGIGTSDDGSGGDDGSAGSGFAGGQSSQLNGQAPGLSVPGLSAPAPGNGSTSGGSHGS